MIETILLSFIVAKIKGYKVSNIFKNWAIYPVIIMEIVVWCCQILIFNGNYSVVSMAGIIKPLYICSYLGLVIKYEIYGQAIIGAGFLLVGGLLNDLVMWVNNGFMPVYPSLSYFTGYTKPTTFNIVNDIHILGTNETRLKILTDYIDLGYCILSIGDVFIRVFIFIIIYYSIKTSFYMCLKEKKVC